MTRDQVRAQRAFKHVGLYAAPEQEDADAAKARRAYGAMCHKLPILIHRQGLSPALHFVAGRGAPAQRALLGHLAAQLHEAGLVTDSEPASLLSASRQAGLGRTRGMTREAQRCLLWYKRFTLSLLKVDAAEEGEG